MTETPQRRSVHAHGAPHRATANRAGPRIEKKWAPCGALIPGEVRDRRGLRKPSGPRAYPCRVYAVTAPEPERRPRSTNRPPISSVSALAAERASISGAVPLTIEVGVSVSSKPNQVPVPPLLNPDANLTVPLVKALLIPLNVTPAGA